MYIFRNLLLYYASICLFVYNYNTLFCNIYILINLYITKVICTVRWCSKCLTGRTGQILQRICAALKTPKGECDLSFETAVYSYIKADNTAAFLYILKIITVQSLQWITISVTEDSSSWEANSFSGIHSIPCLLHNTQVHYNSHHSHTHTLSPQPHSRHLTTATLTPSHHSHTHTLSPQSHSHPLTTATLTPSHTISLAHLPSVLTHILHQTRSLLSRYV
jgi:hypothetical protein